MRIRAAAAVLLALGLVAPTVATPQTPRAEHIVLITIDGFRPEFYGDASWPAPMIQQMAHEGAHAGRVRGVFPTVTYPAHTTLVTGALPARHGIFDNVPFEPAGQSGRWYRNESAIRVPTLWDAVKESGGTTASIAWPVTVGAPIDWNIPDIWPLDREGEWLRAMREGTTPRSLFEEVEREAAGRLGPGTFGGDLNRDDRLGAIAAYLLETRRPTLLTLHLIGVDHFQHEEGRDGPMVRRAVAAVDRAIAAVVEAAARAGILERTAFVVAGDHGFVDIHTRVSPNVWLVEAGLMQARPDRGDWRATFHNGGGSIALYLKDPADSTTLGRVRSLLAARPARERKLFRIIEREALARLGADPRVPLALAAAPGVVLTPTARGPAITAARGGTHGYVPTDMPEIYTGFVGWGAGFRPGAVAPELGLEDIAPLIAELLGLSFDSPDGMLYPGLLTPAVAPAS